MLPRSFYAFSFAVLSLSLVACAGADDEATQSDESAATSSAARTGGRFETFVGLDGKNYFRLVAANNLNLLRSEAYEQAAGPKEAIDSLLAVTQPGGDNRMHVVEGKAVEASKPGFYVTITGRGASTEIVASSEIYASRSNAEAASKTILGYLKGIANAEPRAVAAGKRFELFRLSAADAPTNENGNLQPFKFVLRAANGETVLASEFYGSKAAALDGIAAVKDYGRLDENYDVGETKQAAGAKKGGVFSLVAHRHSAVSENAGEPGNHEAVGFSEIYASVAGANEGADAVRDLLQSDIDLVDLTQ